MFDMIERNLADVKRWGIVRTIRTQSVTDHSYFVTLWTLQLMRMLGITDPQTLLDAVDYASRHDMSELVSGDVPTPLKARLPKGLIDKATQFRIPPVPEPTDFVRQVVKVIDLFEAAVFLAEEMNIGNLRVQKIYDVILGKLGMACTRLGMMPNACWSGQGSLYGFFLNKLIDTINGVADPFEEQQVKK